MKLLMYSSLILALALFVAFTFHKKFKILDKKVMVLISVAVSVALIMVAVAYNNVSKQSQKQNDEDKQKILQAIDATNTEKAKTKVLSSPRINVEMVVSPAKVQQGKELSIKFVVKNLSDSQIQDLRMNFTEGKLQKDFKVKKIQAEGTVYLIESLIALGNLSVGEEREVELLLLPISNLPYKGKIHWQAGNTYILDSNEVPVVSSIALEQTDSTSSEDEDSNDSDDLSYKDEVISKDDTDSEESDIEEPVIDEDVSDRIDPDETDEIIPEEPSVDDNVYDFQQ